MAQFIELDYVPIKCWEKYEKERDPENAEPIGLKTPESISQWWFLSERSIFNLDTVDFIQNAARAELLLFSMHYHETEDCSNQLLVRAKMELLQEAFQKGQRFISAEDLY